MRLRLREVREAKWLTQAELGDRAGISRASVNAIETGRSVPRISTVRKLAKALGVTPDELVAREDAPPAGKPPGGRRGPRVRTERDILGVPQLADDYRQWFDPPLPELPTRPK